jgi:hypothetical protein
MMRRGNLIAVALFCTTVAACSPAPESSSGSSSPNSTIQTADQNAARLEFSAEKIMRDVVGRVIKITNVAGDSPPTDWTFEADEFKQAEILMREGTPAAAVLTVFMTTRNNPGPEEDAVQVSGKLKLHYQRKGGAWVLTTIENLTFHYTIGVST